MTGNKLADCGQNFWQLSVIQLAGWTSLPILATSILILQHNSLTGAVLTVVVGNAILWFIRLGIIGMSFGERWSTLDLGRVYFGRVGSYFVAVLLLVSTLAWFIAQTRSGGSALTDLMRIREDAGIDQFAQMSVFLGVVSAFLCMEGMVMLRKLSTWCFPVLIVAFFVIVFTAPEWRVVDGEGWSLSGLSLVLATNLGITADLPTFFRHSRSWEESLKALTVIQLVCLGLGICSLFFGSIIGDGFMVDDGAVLGAGSSVLRWALIIFVFLSVICANVANVYSASVGWEVVAPKALVGRREYLILGLTLTTIFILLFNAFSVEFLLHAADSSLVNLSLVLILAYMVHRYLGMAPNGGQQAMYFVAWLGATVANVLQYSGVLGEEISPFLVGLMICGCVVTLSFVKDVYLKKIQG